MVKSLGERIKELRKKKGFSQTKLAEELKIGRSAVGLYETNARKPDPETIVLIADYFGVHTDYLLGRDDFLNSSNVKNYEKRDNESLSIEDRDEMVKEMIEVAEKHLTKKRNGS